MSRLRRFQPAKKAWKSFSSTLQSKVHNLNISTTIKTTIQRALSALHSLRRHLIPSKRRRALTGPHRTTYYQVHRKNFAAIRIDDLYAEPTRVSVLAKGKNSCAQAETSRENEVFGRKDLPESSGEIDTIEDAWKAVVARSPHLRVDERAEEFISGFRKDMKIQKERSLLEFQEMLARGT